MERELIFSLQAVQMGLVDARDLVEAGLAWSRGDAEDLREEIVRRGNISREHAALLDQTVELAARRGRAGAAGPLANEKGEEGGRRALESLGGGTSSGTPAQSLGELAPDLPHPSAADPVTPEHAGRYTVRGERGRGGIGRVLVAFDEHIGREIAIKELLGPAQGGSTGPRSERGTERFLREARLTGQLEHPAIVPVYEVGRRSDGTLYYAMRLVRGRTLEKALKDCKSVDERLALLPHFSNLCSAVAYAHSRGVLHRDLKPQNVMIGEFGETVLLDWGLAKSKGSADEQDRRFARQLEALREVAAGHTVAGEALGTPEYMPPEQAWGDLSRVDEHSDVYALGAVLYELLTGRAPFTGEMAFEVIGKVQRYGDGREALPPARSLEPRAPRELCAIAEKALAARPEARYSTAKALLDDVGSYMAGRRVEAYEYGSLELLRKVVRRNPAVAGLVALLALVLLLGSAILLRALRTARAERALAEANERLVHRHLAAAYEEKAALLAEQKDFLAARIFAAASLRESPFNPLGSHADPAALASEEGASQLASLQSTLSAAAEHRLVRHALALPAHPAGVAAIAFSPNGALLATACYDGAVRLFEATTGARGRVLDAKAGAVLALAFSKDGRLLATAGSGPDVQLWSLPDGARLASIPSAPGGGDGLAFSPDGEWLALAGRDGTVRLLSASERRDLGPLGLLAGAHEGTSAVIAFDGQGGALAVGQPAGEIELYDVRQRALIASLRGHERAIRALAFAPSGDRLLSLGEDHTVRLWSTATGRELDLLPLGELRAGAMAAHFEGNAPALVALSNDDLTELWSPASSQRVAVLRGHEGAVRALAFAAQGGRLATAGLDQRVLLWDVSPGGPVRLSGHTGAVVSLAVPSDGAFAASASKDHTVRLFRLSDGAALGLLEVSQEELTAVALSADGRLLAAAGRDGVVRLFDPLEQKLLATLPGRPSRGGALAMSPRGDRVAVAASGAVRLWDAAPSSPREAPAREFDASDGAAALAFSPDGSLLAVSGDRRVRLIAPEDGAVRLTLDIPERARALAFSPAGDRLAVADRAKLVHLFALPGGARLRTLRGPTDVARGLAFSPDGALLATANGLDNRAWIWDAATGRPLQHFRLPDVGRAVAFVDSGRAVLLGEGESAVIHPLALDLWRRDPEPLLEEAQREAGMALDGFSLQAR
jgi:WD40 repeat protein